MVELPGKLRVFVTQARSTVSAHGILLFCGAAASADVGAAAFGMFELSGQLSGNLKPGGGAFGMFQGRPTRMTSDVIAEKLQCFLTYRTRMIVPNDKGCNCFQLPMTQHLPCKRTSRDKNVISTRVMQPHTRF
jgi:hypothetical protein